MADFDLDKAKREFLSIVKPTEFWKWWTWKLKGQRDYADTNLHKTNLDEWVTRGTLLKMQVETLDSILGYPERLFKEE